MGTVVESASSYIKDNPYLVSGGALVGVGYWLWRRSPNQIPIPKYGFSIPLPRVFSSLKLMMEGHQAFVKLYSQYPMALIPARGRWMVIVQGQYIEEINAAPDDVLNFEIAMEELIQTRYTMGMDVRTSLYHHKPIQNQMTRKLNIVYPDVYDEMQFTFNEKLKVAETDWQTVKTFDFVQSVVACATNRVFVGLPLCRNREWLNLMQKNALSVIATAYLITAFPKFMRPIVGPLFSTIDSKIDQAVSFLGSIVDERLEMDRQQWPEDFISWLLAVAPEKDKNPREVARRLLLVNFAAIHTSTMNLTHALYWLLARPAYIESIRQEINEVTAEMGWTKEGISHMTKLDSFMKECQRINPLGALVMNRTVLKPFTFSNGITLPTGTMVCTHQWAVHHDGDNYSNPEDFDGERFVESDYIQSEKATNVSNGHNDDEKPKAAEGARRTMYTTSKTYMAFGHGRHACPGRFFASLELKGIMAYIIANYDIKWPDSVVLDSEGHYRPKDMWIGATCVPNRNAEMMLRKRNKL